MEKDLTGDTLKPLEHTAVQEQVLKQTGKQIELEIEVIWKECRIKWMVFFTGLNQAQKWKDGCS